MDMEITQKKLAEIVGCTPRHINRVFKGQITPSVRLAQKIERVTGIAWVSWFEKSRHASPENK